MMNTSTIVPAAVFVLYALYTISAAALPYRNLPVFQRTIRSAQQSNLYGNNANVRFNISLTQADLDMPDSYSDCPDNTAWPEQGIHRASTCPWKWNKKDLGRDYYPRYIKQAVCLCPTCMHLNAYACQGVPVKMTVFRNVGRMRLVAEEREFNVSCTCVGNLETITTNEGHPEPDS
ncbi:hypothetical protein BgiBS90_016191 [Biomphalaria glabrata]|nr:hypothetical protein BgiBS90_016191 [Biomphalaria glabrata]